MNTLLKYLGIILVLLGVLCLAIYFMGVQENALLITALALELVGVISFIVVNRFIKW